MRLEARIKMGYYPTPLDVVDKIRSFLSYPCERVNVLDPCCGEGLALKNLVQDANAVTYGIELDNYRAEQAKGNIDHILRGSYEDARVSNNAFSCLFLNPPYDWNVSTDSDEGSDRRTEKTFLKGTVRYVQPEGVLVYIVPQKRVTYDIARLLAYRFDDFNPYRFPDEEYDRFRQIVLFGKKKPKGFLDDQASDRLHSIPGEELEQIPYLERPIYELPASPEVRLFRSSIIDEEELEKELGDSPLWKRLREYGGGNKNNVGRPPLPLHSGHLGLLLASGCLDGVVGEGEDRHVVRGKVEKVTHVEQEYHDEALIEREIESYRVSIKVLKKDGDIVTLV